MDTPEFTPEIMKRQEQEAIEAGDAPVPTPPPELVSFLRGLDIRALRTALPEELRKSCESLIKSEE